QLQGAAEHRRRCLPADHGQPKHRNRVCDDIEERCRNRERESTMQRILAPAADFFIATRTACRATRCERRKALQQIAIVAGYKSTVGDWKIVEFVGSTHVRTVNCSELFPEIRGPA